MDFSQFSNAELQIIEASRYVNNYAVVVVGSGVALAVAMQAQKSHAPQAGFIFDSGAINPEFNRVPISVTDPVLGNAFVLGSMRDVLGCLLQGGRVQTGIISAAQVDRFGNINSSYSKTGEDSSQRLPGAGGANAIVSFVQTLIVVTRHEKRRLPERCDYITSAGFVHAAGSRRRAGTLRIDFTVVLVTDLCVMTTSKETGEMEVLGLMPGVSEEQVRLNMNYVPKIRQPVDEIEPPSVEELRILRELVDPEKIYSSELRH